MERYVDMRKTIGWIMFALGTPLAVLVSFFTAFWDMWSIIIGLDVMITGWSLAHIELTKDE